VSLGLKLEATAGTVLEQGEAYGFVVVSSSKPLTRGKGDRCTLDSSWANDARAWPATS
jgi:hypothetical protein